MQEFAIAHSDNQHNIGEREALCSITIHHHHHWVHPTELVGAANKFRLHDNDRNLVFVCNSDQQQWKIQSALHSLSLALFSIFLAHTIRQRPITKE